MMIFILCVIKNDMIFYMTLLKLKLKNKSVIFNLYVFISMFHSRLKLSIFHLN